MMDSVIKTLYWCDVANKFFYLSGSIAFIFVVICIGTLAFIMFMYFAYKVKADGKRPQELILPAKIILAASFFSFISVPIGTDFMPSSSAQKKIIEAKIATALADNSLSQPERDYLQKLAESYALKSEVAEK